MKKILIMAFMTALSLLASGDNRRLMAERVKELQELNRQVLEKIKGLEQYSGKDIYVKVRVVQKPDGSSVAIVDKISIDKIELDPADVAGKVLYLKGTVSKSLDDSVFKLDLEHVLPEEGDAAAGKSGAEASKKNQKEGNGKK
ncbi:MAG: hypothetical protein A2020_04300 [Lentisphaerae bacterium GWF2_45_14]|nr:MAG: hypothetical protein A2020_04300 [Lentisphaerae bacterium GWF2_45_14]